MDTIDRRILEILRNEARATFQDLGDATGLSAPAAYNRVRKLEAAGVITGYHAAIDPEKIGLPVTAIVTVTPPSGVLADHPSWRTAPAFIAGFQLIDGNVVLLGNFASIVELGNHVAALKTAGCQVQVQISQSTGFTRGSPLGI